MDREKRFHELDAELEKLSTYEKNFILWLLLREYQAKLDVPEHLDTIEDYRKYIVNHGLYVDCNNVIEMLGWELWR